MKIENIIRRVLREEQEEEKLLKIPSIRTFNNDWNVLQKYLEFRGNPKYSIGGDLKLRESDIKTLGNLVRVGGNLDLYGCEKLQSLGDLKYVGGDLILMGCKNLVSLGDLEYVGLRFAAAGSNIESFGNLKYVGDSMFISETPLSKNYTTKQIKNTVNVIRHIYNDR
jgi:hypothetical protein